MVREIEKKGKKKIKENNWKKITTIAKNEREILFFFSFFFFSIRDNKRVLNACVAETTTIFISTISCG